jgi:hypothetical protein
VGGAEEESAIVRGRSGLITYFDFVKTCHSLLSGMFIVGNICSGVNNRQRALKADAQKAPLAERLCDVQKGNYQAVSFILSTHTE